MAKSNIIKALEELDKNDIYSLILFVLYRLKDVPEYSTLSELVYILDNESFINFLNYYGGTTITIPKVEDLKNVVNAIMFYERSVNTEMSEAEILKDIGVKAADKAPLLKLVYLIKELTKDYDFKRDVTL